MTIAKGGCACDQVRYEAELPALFVHCSIVPDADGNRVPRLR